MIGLKEAIGLIAGVAIWLGAVAPAFAADFYVDPDTGPFPMNVCTMAEPCQTIQQGVDRADDDPTPDTVHVAPDTYAESVSITNSPMTLLGGGGTTTVVDPVVGAGFSIDGGTSARTVQGFRIFGAPNSLSATAVSGVSVIDNVFNDLDEAVSRHIDGVGSPLIMGNVIDASDGVSGTDSTIGISVSATSGTKSPQIIDNEIAGAGTSISITGDDATTILVAENTLEVADTQSATTQGGIALNDASGVIRDNRIVPDSSSPPMGTTKGIFNASAADSTGTIQMARNQIYGLSIGVDPLADDPLTMNGDIIAQNGVSGVDDSTTPNSLMIFNATLFNEAGPDVRLDGAGSVTIDSTIIMSSNGVQADGDPGTPTCTSNFNRGPGPADLCADATTAFAQFSSQTSDGTGFHLTANNPTLIDMGNPATTTGTDRDGDPFALDGITDSVCNARRDIGADEVVAAPSSCPVPPPTPPTTPAATPPTPPPAATGLRAAALKKCKKKKTSSARKKCKKKANLLPV